MRNGQADIGDIMGNARKMLLEAAQEHGLKPAENPDDLHTIMQVEMALILGNDDTDVEGAERRVTALAVTRAHKKGRGEPAL